MIMIVAAVFPSQLSQEIAKATKEGKIILTVGGDHRYLKRCLSKFGPPYVIPCTEAQWIHPFLQ